MARRALPVSLYNGVNTSPAYPFRVSGISADVIAQYRHLSNEELQKHRVIRRVADEKPGFPCRVSLVDAEVGESVLLLNFEHLPGLSPYRSVGPIFVRESASETYSKANEIPARPAAVCKMRPKPRRDFTPYRSKNALTT